MTESQWTEKYYEIMHFVKQGFMLGIEEMVFTIPRNRFEEINKELTDWTIETSYSIHYNDFESKDVETKSFKFLGITIHFNIVD